MMRGEEQRKAVYLSIEREINYIEGKVNPNTLSYEGLKTIVDRLESNLRIYWATSGTPPNSELDDRILNKAMSIVKRFNLLNQSNVN